MKVLRPRSRIISIRISEEEFCALQRICVARGARSLSDLAREAMREAMNPPRRKNGGDNARDAVYALIKDLEQKIEKLSVEIARVKAARKPAGARRRKA